MRDKFVVKFGNSSLVSTVEVSRFDSLEEAVSLALALHRSSNLPHVVFVVSDVHCSTELTLKLFDDEK